MVRIVVLVLACLWLVSPVYAQGPATPIPVNPPTATVTPLPPTDVPTRTPTSLGPASAEAIQAGTNVRAEPDVGADLVKQISPGQTYPIVGKFFEWYQLQFPESRTGVAWVHNSVVQVIGDVNLIPDISADQLPTVDPLIVSAGETAEAITQTPGAVFTLTADALANPTIGDPLAGNPLGNDPNAPQALNVVLPTFTFPAETATPLKLSDIGSQQLVTVDQGGLPPIAPILGFLGIGALGLLITFLRR